MSTYSLNLTIDAASLQQILASGLQIVLAKQLGGGAPNVVWQAFQPLLQSSVSWNGSSQGLYASQTPIQPGAQIVMTTSLPAVEAGQAYTYANGSFLVTGPGAPGVVTVQNTSFGSVTVGLTQNAVINGQGGSLNPQNAAQSNFQMNVYLTPGDTVQVWIGSEPAGTVLAGAPGNATTVKFGGGTTSASLTYDAASGRFIVR